MPANSRWDLIQRLKGYTPLPVAHSNGHIKTISNTERGLTYPHVTRQHTATGITLAHSLQCPEVTQ